MITVDDVRVAAERIAPYVRVTPVLRGARVSYKLEYLQHTGSFKARGALNRVLAAKETGLLDPAVGVIAASGGNAGLAVAYAAARVGAPAEVWVPETAPPVKVAKLRALGATVVPRGREYADAYRGAVERAEVTGAVFCHAYDEDHMVAGAGTIALELAEPYDTVIVAVGGGGLMGGVTTGLAGAARVVAVEPVAIPTLHDALAAGGPVDVAVSGVAADSLGARRIGDLGYAIAVAAGVRSVLVDDDAIVAARSRLWSERRIVVEHGAAAAYAALTSGAYAPEPDERVLVILCGANTNPADL